MSPFAKESVALLVEGVGEITPEVAAFCEQHGLLDHLRRVAQLAREHLPLRGPIAVELECDGDSAEEWLVINVTLAGEEEEVRAAYRRYVKARMREIPWPEVSKIRTCYGLVA